MLEIFKLCQVKNNKIDKIYVFKGDENITLSDDLGPKGKGIFNSEEESYNVENNVDIVLIDVYILKDDSMFDIKNKLIVYGDILITIEELYMFYFNKSKLELYSEYDKIKGNMITNDILNDYMKNIYKNPQVETSLEKVNYEEKSSLSFYEFGKIPIDWGNESYLLTPVDININYSLPVIFNPYKLEKNNRFLDSNSSTVVSTNMNKLLFNLTNLFNNSLYFCTTEDIIDYHRENSQITQDYILKIYFPLLYTNYKISNISQLLEKRSKIYEKTVSKNESNIKRKYENVITFTRLINTKKIDDSYVISKGIRNIHFTLKNSYSMKIPLENIFKLIHSDETILVIKYNPGNGFENIYKMYSADNVSTKGDKIPEIYVQNKKRKGKINNIINNLSKKTSIGFHIKYNGISYNSELYENGDIDFIFDFNEMISISKLEDNIKGSFNSKILNPLKMFLGQSGYSFDLFDKLIDEKVKINTVDYELNLNYNKKINLNKFLGCVSSLFVVNNGILNNQKDVIDMVYKRVSFYKNMDAISKFITIQTKKNSPIEFIIEGLIENFSLSEVEAKKKIDTWSNEMLLREDTFGSSKILEYNPGFSILIKNIILKLKNGDFKQGLNIIVSNINDLNYIDYVYNNLLALFELIDSTNDSVVKRCKKKIKEIQVKDLEVVIDKTQIKNILVGDTDDDISDAESVYYDSDQLLDLDDFLMENETEVVMDPNENVESVKPQTKSPVTSSVVSDADAIKISQESPMVSPVVSEVEVSKPKTKSSMTSPVVSEAESVKVSQDSPIVSDAESIKVSQDSPKVSEGESIKISQDSPIVSEAESIKVSQDSPIVSEAESIKVSQDSPIMSDIESLIDESNTPEDKMNGGKTMIGGNDGVIATNFEGKKISDFIFDKLHKREPSLFRKEHSKLYKSYAKACPMQFYKQPIILNKDEKKYIDDVDKKKGMKSYDEYLTYSSKEDKEPYHYICPRFWCISDENKKGRSLTFEQINNGECGGWDAVIPEKTKKIPKNKRIIHFTDIKYHREGMGIEKNTKESLAVYKPMYPSYMDRSKHPNNSCVPCCYNTPTTENDDSSLVKDMYKADPLPVVNIDPKTKKMIVDGEEQIRANPTKKRVTMFQECDLNSTQQPKKSQESTDGKQKVEVKKKPGVKRKLVDDVHMIQFDKGPTRETFFPLDTNRIGYIPMSLQIFLGFDNSERCYKRSKYNINTNLKQDNFCLLRQGVEKNINQSFLSCFANIYFDIVEKKDKDEVVKLYSKPNKRKNLASFKQVIIKNLTFDKFCMANYGNLITLFSNDSISNDSEELKKLFMENKKSITIKHINNKNKSLSVLKSYYNFISFLKDDQSFIDYTYMWDLFCKPINKGGILFNDGINLIIFNNPDDSMLDKVELICPKNYYSNTYYNPNKGTLLLYSHLNIYECIYKVKEVKTNNFIIHKLLDEEYISTNLPEFKKILTKVNNEKLCLPIKSINEYDFIENLTLLQYEEKFKKGGEKYKISKQVVSKRMYVYGLIITDIEQSKSFFIPCKKSPIIMDTIDKYPIVREKKIVYKTYDETYDMLNTLHNTFDVPLKPKIKLVNKEVVVGIITQTNQFVPTKSEPFIDEPDKYGDIKVIKNDNDSIKNEYKLNKMLVLSNDVDNKRVQTIKSIKMENSFYNMFRNTLRLIINKRDKIDEKKRLLELLKSSEIAYKDKLVMVENNIRNLLTEYVDFSKFNIDNVGDIFTCLNLNNKECGENNLCGFSSTGNCMLIIPNKNLISGFKNDTLYYGKLSDELIRKYNIREYIFSLDSFMFMEDIKYNLNDDEILLMEDILINYFEDITVKNKNKYIKKDKVYDFAKPDKSDYFKEYFSIIDKDNEVSISKCFRKKKKVNFYKSMGLNNFNEMIIKQNKSCSFLLILYIINHFIKYTNKVNETNTPLQTLEDIKRNLITSYKNNFDFDDEEDIKALKLIFNKSNKSYISKSIEKYTIEHLIMSDDYYITDIDLYFLSVFYNLPCVVISVDTNKQLPFASNVTNSIDNIDVPFVYIIACRKIYTKINIPPEYSILADGKTIYIKKELHDVSKLIRPTLPFRKIVDTFMLKHRKQKLEKGKQLKKGSKKKIIVVN